MLPASTVNYSYMRTGDVTRPWRATTDGLSVEEFSYDTLGRFWAKTLTLVSQPAYPLITSYGYDGLNRPTEITYPAQYGVTGSPRRWFATIIETGNENLVTVDGEPYGRYSLQFGWTDGRDRNRFSRP